MQAKRTEKKTAVKNERNAKPVGTAIAEEVDALKNGAASMTALSTKGDFGPALQRSTSANTQNTLNTTVWNSAIIREHVLQSSPPLER